MKNLLGFISIIVFVFLLTAIQSSCRGTRRVPVLPAADNPDAASVATDVEDYNPPTDVDPGVFEMLRDEFLKEIGTNPERTSASAPMGDAGRVTDLVYDSGSGMLTWTYVNLGDYNLSGDVSIADVAEIARYYLADATDGEGDDPFEAWVDGSWDGEVNIADVAPLANNYLNEVAEYVILTSAIPSDGFFEIGRVDFSDAKTPSGMIIMKQEGAHSWAPADISRRGGQEWPPSSYDGDKTPSQTGSNFPKIFEVALPEGALQYIAVEPVDALGSVGVRSGAVGTVVAVEPPLPPSDLAASEGTSGVITLTWSKSVGAAWYLVYRDSQVLPVAIAGDTDTWDDADLSDIVTHTYWLRAMNDAGVSEFSESDTGFRIDPPLPPESLAASDGEYSFMIELSWVKSAGATGYEIYRDIQDEPIESVGDVDTWDDTTVGDTLPHTYWLKATNAAGDSDFSESDTGYMIEPPTPPAPPTDFEVSDGEYADKILLTWTGSEGATGYKIYRDGKEELSVVDEIDAWSAWPDREVADLELYTYWMRAVNDVGESDFSAPDTGYLKGRWNIEIVDSAGNTFSTGTFSGTIALDSSDNPHISYWGGPTEGLKYTYYDGASWQVETVDNEGSLGMPNSIALDSSDNPHISYYDGTNSALKYAYYNGTSWQIETVDSEGKVGYYNSIVLDSSDNPHISYYDSVPNQDLKYAYYDGASWQIETVDTEGDVGTHSSIVLDTSDNAHVSYQEYIEDLNSELKYAYYDGSSWQFETVDSDGSVGYWTSIALDSSDNPHISYHAYFEYQDEDLKYAYYDGASWQIETVDNQAAVGYDTSIALDSQDNPHISYYSYQIGSVGDGDLIHAFYDGASWHLEIADSLYKVGKAASIAIDSEDNAHISYHDYFYGTINYAYLSGG